MLGKPRILSIFPNFGIFFHKLGKSDKMRDLPSILSPFHNVF